MENKPLVTYIDDQQDLFLRLLPYISRGLPRESIQWKRSFGRPSRNVTVSVNFVPFSDHSLFKSDSWYLSSFPFLHTFWAASDIDAYKSSTKEQISEWLSHLKEKDISDWLIIVLTNDDNQLKNKILRTSVYDRVKNDFCNKLPDRVILFPEPFRSDSKASDSWNQVLSRLRSLLLESYDKHLSRFDDFMRVQRERRTDPVWSFTGYFLLQEELALTYEMLGLYEDALIQYDELDALFTQFIVNYSAGGEQTPWLIAMKNTKASRWDGVYLFQPIDLDRKRLITSSNVSLLDLRTYLLSRICFLLLSLNRLEEVEQRALLYLHNCVRELHTLMVDLPEGAIACWINLSCLEILKFCSMGGSNGSLQSYNIYSSNLLDYARIKTKELGKICGLMSKEDDHPNSIELMKTVDILAGFLHPDGEPENLSRLREALSSKSKFQKFYLDLSEQSMCALKHIGRRRSAKLIGKDLADYYIIIGDYKKAEVHLVEAMKTYKYEGWEMLAHHTRIQLALCQKELQLWKKYCRTCLYLSTSNLLSKDLQLHYKNEIENINTKSVQQIRSYPAFFVRNLKPDSDELIHGNPCSFSLTIDSYFISPMEVDDVRIVFRRLDDSNVLTSFDLFSKKTLFRQLSNLSGQSASFLNTHTDMVDIASRSSDGNSNENTDEITKIIGDKQQSMVSTLKTDKISTNPIRNELLFRKRSDHSILSGVELYNKIRESIEYSFQPVNFDSDIGIDNNGLNISSRIVCKTPLRRMNSVPLSDDFSSKCIDEKNDLYLVFKYGSSLVIHPGFNILKINGKFDTIGSYVTHSILITYKHLDFVDYLKNESIHFKVIPAELNVSLTFLNEHPIENLAQKIMLEIQPKYLKENFCKHLEISSSDNIVISSEALDDKGKLMNSEKYLIKTDMCRLPINIHPYFNGQLNPHNYYIIIKLNDHEDILCKLNLYNSFHTTHNIITSFKRKFLQLAVKNISPCNLIVKDWFLTDENNILKLVSLNDSLSPQVIFYVEQSCFFVWEIFNTDELSNQKINLQFSLKLNYVTNQCEQFGIYSYHYQLNEIETKYVISIQIDADNNIIALNDWSFFKIKVEAIANNNIPLFYKIMFDETIWQVSGVLQNDIIFQDNLFETQISAKPLLIGNLTLPSLNLYSFKKSHGNATSLAEDAESISSTSSTTSPSSPPHSISSTFRSSISSTDLSSYYKQINPLNVYTKKENIVKVVADAKFPMCCEHLLINIEDRTVE